MPQCPLCKTEMRKTVTSTGNAGGIAGALIAFCIGVVIFAAIPIIGWVLGPLVCLASLFMGGKRQAVWKCGKCGTIFNRAGSVSIIWIISAVGLGLLVLFWLQDDADIQKAKYTADEEAAVLPARSAVPTPPQKTITADRKQWYEIDQWQGEENQETGRFTIGSNWCIEYETAAPPNADGHLWIFLYNDKEESEIAVNVAGTAKDVVYQKRPGTFYLRINATQPYIVRVLELQSMLQLPRPSFRKQLG